MIRINLANAKLHGVVGLEMTLENGGIFCNSRWIWFDDALRVLKEKVKKRKEDEHDK